MPVILPAAAEAHWLDQRIAEPQQLLSCLTPYPAEAMVAYPVSSLVNSPRHNSPECIVPLAEEDTAC
jgi:putative SOS response-associated peptidase YedK